MNSSYSVDGSRKVLFPDAFGRSLPPGGGGGDNDDMEARVQILEQSMTDVRERLARIETRLEQTATKNDVSETKSELYKAINAQTWRVIGASATLVAAVFFIVRYLPPAS